MIKFLVGLFIGVGVSASISQVIVSVPTNGVLLGYVVQKDSKEICKDPTVWNKFRSETSYIVCQ